MMVFGWSESAFRVLVWKGLHRTLLSLEKIQTSAEQGVWYASI